MCGNGRPSDQTWRPRLVSMKKTCAGNSHATLSLQKKKEIKWNFQGKHRISKLLKALAHLAPKLGHSHHQRLPLTQPTGSTATTKISLYFSTFKIDFSGSAAHWTWKPGSVLVPCPATASATLQLEDTAPTRDKINGTHIQLCWFTFCVHTCFNLSTCYLSFKGVLMQV